MEGHVEYNREEQKYKIPPWAAGNVSVQWIPGHKKYQARSSGAILIYIC